MQAMIGFTKALMSMPMPWQLWIGLLVAVNVAGPIYFFEALEAKVVLAAFLASAASMMAIFAAKGFVRLLGIGHIFWIPMVPWLWTREPGIGTYKRTGKINDSRCLRAPATAYPEIGTKADIEVRNSWYRARDLNLPGN